MKPVKQFEAAKQLVTDGVQQIDGSILESKHIKETNWTDKHNVKLTAKSWCLNSFQVCSHLKAHQQT
jgi:hypothetical protein